MNADQPPEGDREDSVEDTRDPDLSPRGLPDEHVETALVGVGVNQVEVQYGAATDVGLVREVNEDSYLADPPVFGRRADSTW